MIIQLRVGGQAARVVDESLPLRCGCIGQETTGFGGLAKALRTVPVVLDIGERARARAPSAENAEEYDDRIREAGGVEVFLRGCGASDGHVGFLPPGSPRAGRTAVVELAESTRRDNLATFPYLANVDDVPTHGVSVGLETIGEARSLRLVLPGSEKQAAAARLLELDRFDPAFPASVVHDHRDAEVWLDREALP